MTAKTTPAPKAAKPAKTGPLVDAKGVALERGMRVTTVKDKRPAFLGRPDEKSRRFVIFFEDEAGGATMRGAHLLEARKHAGKVLRVKEAVKAAKAPAKAKGDAPKKETAKRATRKNKADAPAPVETVVPAEVEEPTAAELAELEAANDTVDLAADLPADAFQV